MRTSGPAGTGGGLAVTVVGLLTVLLGGGYAALGGSLILAGAGWWARSGGDPWGPVVTLFGIVPALFIAIGTAFLLQGVLGVPAGLGVLGRKRWGRILTFVLAGLAIVWGLVWVGGGSPDAPEIALGAAQVLYGALAVVVLIREGAEFSRGG